MNNLRHILKTLVIIIAAAVILPGMALAGDLEPSAGPASTMKTLDEIYNKIEAINDRTDPEPVQCDGTPVAKTGQTISYAASDDGDIKPGVPWPNPRFTDNGDGTVTDNLTKLIWLKCDLCG